MNKIVSIFSGVGGIDCGFHQAGFNTIFANDNWQIACDSFKLNYPEAEVKCASIADVDFKIIKEKYGPIDGLVGGPPCPPFSKSRFYRTDKKRGIEDENGFLTVSNYFRALEELDPKFFFFENVAGFVFKPHAAALEMLKEESERLGYKIQYRVVNSANYGVAQIRQRFICVGVKKDMPDFIFPEETHSEKPDENHLDVIIEAKYGDYGGQYLKQWTQELTAYDNEYGKEEKPVIFIAVGGNMSMDIEEIKVRSRKHLIFKCNWLSLLIATNKYRSELKRISVPDMNISATLRLLDNIILAFNIMVCII